MDQIPDPGGDEFPMMIQAEMTCTVCSNQWTARYPIIAMELECSVCGYFTPAPELPDENYYKRQPRGLQP
jgi:hypothetical protein